MKRLLCCIGKHDYKVSDFKFTGHAIKYIIFWVPEKECKITCRRCGKEGKRDLIAAKGPIDRYLYPDHFKENEFGFPLAPDGTKLIAKDAYAKWE